MSNTSAHQSHSWRTAFLAGIGGTALVAAAVAGGCVVEQPSTLGPATTGVSSSAASTGGDPSDAGTGGSNKAEELFAGLQSDLFTTCGACHDAGGIADTPFLAGPDRYRSVVSWPGIVAKDPSKSLFVTYAVMGGGHSGFNLDGKDTDPTLLPRVKAWLQEEANGIAEPAPEIGPAIEPFLPILGFNAVYLGPLGADFEGMALTFNANELSEKTLELSQIQVHTTSKVGVHLAHPLFVVYPLGGEPDPDNVDSFSNVDQYFAPGTAGELGPSTLLLTNWKPKAKLSVAFEIIEKIATPTDDGGMDGGTTGCKDVAAFKANAEQQFTIRCSGCHAGSNGAATNAVDMSALNKDSAAVCEQLLNRVNPGDPSSSQIFTTTDPTKNAAHPFKFGGNQGNFNGFRDAVSMWISAEK